MVFHDYARAQPRETGSFKYYQRLGMILMGMDDKKATFEKHGKLALEILEEIGALQTSELKYWLYRLYTLIVTNSTLILKLDIELTDNKIAEEQIRTLSVQIAEINDLIEQERKWLQDRK